MSNLVAAEATIARLRAMGRLEDVDGARVAGFLSMAGELDRDPGNASLWRAYWQVEAALREDIVDDGELDALLAELGDPQMGDRTHR